MQRLNSPWPLVPAVILFFFLALNSVTGDSPTMDEQNHLGRGLAWWRTGDPRLSLEHPPLINALSTAPLLTLDDIRLPTDHPSWSAPFGWYEFSRLLLWEYNHDVTRMVFLGRLPIIFLSLGLALTAFHLARDMWGVVAGWAALLLTLLDPNILAHGRYSTTDVGATTFTLLTFFLFWRLWRDDGRWRRWPAAAVALALAFGSKLSTLTFVPILALLSLLPLYGARRSWRDAGRRVVQLMLAGMTSLPLIWALYRFEWRNFAFQSEQLQSLNALAGPMPTFWAGIEQILLLSGGGRPAFLLGQFSVDGFWAYFPVAFLVKTPLALLLLLVPTLFLLLLRPALRARALFLLLPAVLYFALSIQSSLNIGYRHLLPIIPLLIVLGSGLAAPRFRPPVRWLPGAAVAGVLIATLAVHPYYLSFFNVAAGGPANGYNILVDSNIDWGQDLLRLKAWMAKNDVPWVRLAWFGSADPAYYDVQYEPLPGLPHHFDLWWNLPFDPARPPPGIYAISVSNLWELPLEEKYVFPAFRAREPDDRVGYSILIYDLR